MRLLTQPSFPAVACLTIIAAGSLLLPTTPVAAAGDADDHLMRQLHQLEQALAAESPIAAGPEQVARLQSQLRWLHHLAEEKGAAAVLERLELLDKRSKAMADGMVKVIIPGQQGTVAGTVTSASSGQPLAGVLVLLWTSDFFSSITDTDASGQYIFQDLAPGEYWVSTENTAGFVDELWEDVVCTGGVLAGCDLRDGTPIEVVDLATTTVDFALDVGGSIAGTVTEVGGEPLSSTKMQLFNAAGVSLMGGFTDLEGNFRLDGLGTGTYFLGTVNFIDYLDELYDDLPCPAGPPTGCDPTTGTSIEVTAGRATSDIDFELAQLGGISGRVTDGLSGDPIPFVDINVWNTQGEFVGSGFTDDTGQYLIGGLRTASYFLTTGNFRGFADELYDDLPCPEANCDPTTGTPVAVELNTTTTGIDFVLTGGCVESNNVLCLNGDRFRVETTWRNFAGADGVGNAIELTDDTGYFWFFEEENVEMVIKVLDACGFPGFNNYWVFAGGLTSVEVLLTVTDTQTGESQQYTNPLGAPFQPIQDTGAFDTCP